MLISHQKLIKVLAELKPELRQKIDSVIREESLETSLKSDETLVTNLDLIISKMFKEKLNQTFPDVSFLSEEDQSDLNFPIFILDPIDGTKELVEGRDEWVISFGLYFSDDFMDERNFSWIYNPLNGLEVSSVDSIKVAKQYIAKILVSRTEFEAGLHDTKSDIKPVGSIAYKLALLSLEKAEVVLSKKPKNIWDVAAGTHILLGLGYKFSSEKEELVKIKTKYNPPLVWKKS